MRYKAPIGVIEAEIMSDLQAQFEDVIYTAVQKVGIDVDKDELIRALKYDRNQYMKGYKDRDAEIIRCKECRYRGHPTLCLTPVMSMDNENWYCQGAERKESEEIVS